MNSDIPGNSDDWDPDETSAFDPSVSSSIPKKLGRYELIKSIGAGGMGVVQQVHDPMLGRNLALKTLRAQLNEDSVGRQRFIEEAQIAGQLQHPGIAPVHEVGQLDDGSPYFTMKLVEGETLAQMLAARSSVNDSLPRFIDIFEQICQTVAYAHSRGVIHRDLKPANIMVGSFGEVQVMDWGLAKVLDDGNGGEATHSPSTEPVGDGSQVRTVRHGDGETDAETLATRDGSVVGTISYMPPEQARGEVTGVDRRADVFALGGILCEILTCEPPYVGEQRSDVFEMARRAELAHAQQRLQEANVDDELKAVCLACLTENVELRLSDGAEVARQIQSYNEGVRQQLEQARADQATAEAQAQAQAKRVVLERSRRRIATALGVALVVLVVGGSGAAIWVQHLQNQRATELARQQVRRNEIQQNAGNAINEARLLLKPIDRKLESLSETRELLDDLDQWRLALAAARSASKSAEHIATNEQLPDGSTLRSDLLQLNADLDAHDARLQFVAKLDAIRLETATLVNNEWNPTHSADRYAELFAEYDFRNGDAKQISAKIRKKPSCFAIVAAIDHWSEVLSYSDHPTARTPDRALQEQLLEVARLADPDPWRDRFRKLETWDDLPTLTALLAEPAAQRQPAPLLISACRRVSRFGGDPTKVVGDALARSPSEFWLHFFMGNYHNKTNPTVSVGHFRAALAIRPNSPVVYNELGRNLARAGEREEAIRCFQKALALNPDFYFAHYNWAEVHAVAAEYDVAHDRFSQTLKIAPDHVPTHNALATARMFQGRYEEAHEHVKRALEIDPNNVDSLLEKARILIAQVRSEEAKAILEKVIRLAPQSSAAQFEFGQLHDAVNDPDAAISCYEKAVALDSTNNEAILELAIAYGRKGDVTRSEQLFQQAASLAVNKSKVYSAWGVAKYDQGNAQEAVVHFRRAIKLLPNSSVDHANLGNAVAATGQIQQAFVHYERALELNSNDSFNHYSYGNALLQAFNLEKAAGHFRRAAELSPEFAEAHCNLGHTLQRMGRFAEALAPFLAGHEASKKKSNWRYPSAWWVTKAQRVIALSQTEKPEKISINEPPIAIKGQLNDSDDQDVFVMSQGSYRKAYAIDLQPGKAYRFELDGDFDAMLRLESQAYQTIAYNAANPQSTATAARIDYQTPQPATLRVIATSAQPSQTGTFTLKISVSSP